MSENKNSNWLPPKDFLSFFKASSDAEFKQQHPVGYFFLAFLGIAALMLPAFLFGFLVEGGNEWIMLGLIGGFIFGIGLFNFVAIIIKQYLGHLVSIICFLLGGIMMLISWFLCR